MSLLLILTFLLRGFAVGVSSSITVGPVAIICIQRTLSKSRRAGIACGGGVATADTLMAIIAYTCYSVLQSQIERYSTILQVIAGIFVVVVGVVIYIQNPIPQFKRNRKGQSSLWQDYISMFGITLANFFVVIPYILAFFALFNVNVGVEAYSWSSFFSSLFIISGFMAGAVTWWALLSWVINLFKKDFRPRHLLIINRVAGVVIGIMGAYTILSTFIHFLPYE